MLKVSPDGIVTAIAEELSPLIKLLGLNIRPAAPVTRQQLQQLTGALAATIRHVFLEPYNEHVKLFLTTEGLRLNYQINEITFSGGVADFIYQPVTPQSISEICRYGDIGPLLGAAVRDAFNQFPARCGKPVETIRATVIGTGIQFVQLSGSTILINRNLLPLKNIPVLRINDLSDQQPVIRAITTLVKETSPAGLALALNKNALGSFADIYRAAERLKSIFKATRMENLPFIIITENDCALALGQTIGILTNNSKIMCIDQVVVDEGDYIDIGFPIDDQAVLVMIKTLVF